MRRTPPQPNVMRWAITRKAPGEARSLAFANQGRNHFDTEEEAVRHLGLLRQNNNPDTLSTFDSQQGKTLEVRPVECYWHGDAIGVFFSDPEFWAGFWAAHGGAPAGWHNEP